MTSRSGSHLLCGTKQKTDLSASYFSEQLRFPKLRICFMYKCDFFRWDTLFYQLVSDVLINIS